MNDVDNIIWFFFQNQNSVLVFEWITIWGVLWELCFLSLFLLLEYLFFLQQFQLIICVVVLCCCFVLFCCCVFGIVSILYCWLCCFCLCGYLKKHKFSEFRYSLWYVFCFLWWYLSLWLSFIVCWYISVFSGNKEYPVS